MKQGVFIISLDFELLWGLAGWTPEQIPGYLDHINGSLSALDRILEVLKQYEMKCTIACVGAMNCNSVDEVRHKMPVKCPSYRNPLFSSSYSLLPDIGKRYKDSLFFCRETLKKLSENSLVEIASHTFSHYYCLEAGQTIGEFEEDIRLAVEEMREYGRLTTIIFPRNQVSEAYLAVCRKYGFTHYRGNPDVFLYRPTCTQSRFSLKGALRLLDTYIPVSGHNCYDPDSLNGSVLKNIPGSRFFRSRSRYLSLLEPLRIHRVKSSMEYAARNGLVYHLWWHPHNFGVDTEKNIKQLQNICLYYKKLQERYGYRSCFISEM